VHTKVLSKMRFIVLPSAVAGFCLSEVKLILTSRSFSGRPASELASRFVSEALTIPQDLTRAHMAFRPVRVCVIHMYA
jgi:hypothetical protein